VQIAAARAIFVAAVAAFGAISVLEVVGPADTAMTPADLTMPIHRPNPTGLPISAAPFARRTLILNPTEVRPFLRSRFDAPRQKPHVLVGLRIVNQSSLLGIEHHT